VLSSVAPQARPTRVATVRSLVRQSLSRQRATALLASIAGAIALLLASLGCYGVAGSWLALRRRDIAIRRALGAGYAKAAWQTARAAVAAALAGLGSGAICGAFGGRVLQRMLMGASAQSGLVLGATATAVVLATGGGFLLAAIAALRVTPWTALCGLELPD
jgi:ABC-type antimicrobial peptide transport system permease subunit